MITSSMAACNNMKKKKTSQGRKKIEIKKIEEVNNRQVTFSKRRAGLFKKASELCILTGAQIAILVNSPGGRIFAFGHPSVDVLVDRYLNTTSTATAYASASGSQKPVMVKEFNQHYMEVSKELEAEKKRREVIEESKVVKGSGVAWYDEAIDGMEVEELEQYLWSLAELKRRVLLRVDEHQMIKKSPSLLGLNMLDEGQPNGEIPTNLNVMAPLGFSFGLGNGNGME